MVALVLNGEWPEVDLWYSRMIQRSWKKRVENPVQIFLQVSSSLLS